MLSKGRFKTAFLMLPLISGMSAASSPVSAEPAPAVSQNPISEALCGRQSDQRSLAELLDDLDPQVLHKAWRRLKIDDLDRWLGALICLDATQDEEGRFQHRHRALEQLRSRLERAHTLERVEAALAPFRGKKLAPDKWPSSSDCPGCAELREAAARVVAVTTSWPVRRRARESRIGPRLDAAAQLEPLVDELCAAKPSPRAREEIETRFRYYSWTAGGAMLFQVAALFEQSDVVAGCRRR